MVEVIQKEKTRFRIYVHDLETKKAKSISLKGNGIDLEGVKRRIVQAFTRK